MLRHVKGSDLELSSKVVEHGKRKKLGPTRSTGNKEGGGVIRVRRKKKKDSGGDLVGVNPQG